MYLKGYLMDFERECMRCHQFLPLAAFFQPDFEECGRCMEKKAEQAAAETQAQRRKEKAARRQEAALEKEKLRLFREKRKQPPPKLKRPEDSPFWKRQLDGCRMPCKTCGVVKPVRDFFDAKSGRFTERCRKCYIEQTKRKVRKARERNRVYYEKHSDEVTKKALAAYYKATY